MLRLYPQSPPPEWFVQAILTEHSFSALSGIHPPRQLYLPVWVWVPSGRGVGASAVRALYELLGPPLGLLATVGVRGCWRCDTTPSDVSMLNLKVGGCGTGGTWFQPRDFWSTFMIGPQVVPDLMANATHPQFSPAGHYLYGCALVYEIPVLLKYPRVPGEGPWMWLRYWLTQWLEEGVFPCAAVRCWWLQ